MPALSIKLDVDRNGGFAALNDATEIVHLADDAHVELGTLRHGMVSGKDSVAFCFKLPDGRAVVVETSADLLMAAGGAVASWQEGRRDRGED